MILLLTYNAHGNHDEIKRQLVEDEGFSDTLGGVRLPNTQVCAEIEGDIDAEKAAEFLLERLKPMSVYRVSVSFSNSNSGVGVAEQSFEPLGERTAHRILQRLYNM